jgi:hypothetical protein
VPIHFTGLDADFVAGFQAYLTKDKGFARNTIGKYMRAFRECLNDAHRNGKGIEVPHALVMRGAIPIPEEETTQIYLNPAELAAMYSLDLSKQPQVGPGSRPLHRWHMDGPSLRRSLASAAGAHRRRERIKVPTAKTGKEVRIPLHPHVREILTKYEGRGSPRASPTRSRTSTSRRWLRWYRRFRSRS